MKQDSSTTICIHRMENLEKVHHNMLVFFYNALQVTVLEL